MTHVSFHEVNVDATLMDLRLMFSGQSWPHSSLSGFVLEETHAIITDYNDSEVVQKNVQ